MTAQSVAEIVNRHVKLSVEGIDRMYRNVFVPAWQKRIIRARECQKFLVRDFCEGGL
jgi:hypothetical protein